MKGEGSRACYAMMCRIWGGVACLDRGDMLKGCRESCECLSDVREGRGLKGWDKG